MTTHRTIITVDLEASGRRDELHQQVIREGLYAAMRTTVDRCGVRWEECDRRDNGDGMVLIAPAGVDNSRLVHSLPHELAGQLRRHNAKHDIRGRIRLRVAVVDGEVGFDDEGPVGRPLVDAARLLDSKALRVALRKSHGTLALITSDNFYHHVVRNEPAANPDIYRKVKVAGKEKEETKTAWVCLPDDYAVPGRARPGPPPRVAPTRHTWHRRARQSAMVLVLLLIALAFPTVLATAPVHGSCGQPVQLNVNVSAEKAPVIRKLMPEFERSARSDTGSCKTVNVQVTVAASTGTVIAALGRSMTGQYDLRDMGPEPHVLLPDSSWEVAATTEKLNRSGPSDISLRNRGSIASSPLVLADPGAVGQDDPRRSWREVLEDAQRALPELGRARVQRPSPLTSGTGLTATIALYAAELGPNLDKRTLTTLDAPRRLHDVEWSITTGERSDTALCALRQRITTSGPSGADSVLVSEKAAADFNEGEALGEQCPRVGDAAPEVGITYPRDGTAYLDHPFVEVTWHKQPANKARQIMIGKLYDFLIDTAAQAELRRAHFRDRGGNIAPFTGAPSELPSRSSPLSVDTLAVLDAFGDARRSARVLFLFDTSTAMAEPFRGAGGTRLRAAADAIAETLQSVGEEDQIGVWDFADRHQDGVAHRVLVPLGSSSSTVEGTGRLPLARDHLRDLRGTGAPGRVFEALGAALTSLRASARSTADTRDAIVLVADGSTVEPDDAEGLVDDLASAPQPIPVFVITFAADACASTEWRAVVESTSGECYQVASVADIQNGLNRVTTALWGEGVG